jgi:thioredoxin-like negative regulator of GroEL
MKKQGKGSKPSKSKKTPASPAALDQPQAPERRSFMRKAAWAAGGLAVIGGATLFGARSVTAKMAEFDLTRLGQGVPTVVQVHDPQCPICTALQKQTRKALRGFENDELVYLVADIKTQNGQVFAGRFGVPHVTLLLFDGDGQLVNTLQGMRQSDEISAAFDDLMR